MPDAFVQGPPPDVFLHFYSAEGASVKTRIVYNQNMIGFLRHGIKEVYTASQHVVIDSSKVVLLNAGSVLMSQSLEGKNDFESILLFFSNRFVSEFLLKYAVGNAKPGTENDGVFTLTKDPFLWHFEEALLLLKEMESAELQKLKLEEVLLYLLRQYPEQTVAFLRKSVTPTGDARLRQTVNENLEKGLSLEELAFLCNMSLSTFKRHFAETFHTSPKKYFTAWRMMKAKELLQLNRRVSEIYGELGYESLSSFSVEFKKHSGISPKQFQSAFEPKEEVFERMA